MKNYQCEHCGAYLDPAEKCDCQDEKEINLKKMMDMLLQSDDGQFVLNVGGCYGVKKL